MYQSATRNRRALFPRLVFSIALLLLVFSTTARAVDVTVKNPVYRYLERCELKGLLHQPLSGSKPYSRRTIAALLVEIDGHRAKLGRIEKQQLDYYLYEFGDNLPKGAVGAPENEGRKVAWLTQGDNVPWKQLHLFRDARYIYSTRGNDYLVAFNPNLDVGYENVDLGTRSGTLKRFATGFQVLGHYRNFGLHAVARDAHLSGDETLSDPTRYPIRFHAENRNSSGFDFDESDAELTYQIPHVSLLFGKTENRWAWGQSGTLLLSDNPTTYTQARAKLDFGPLEVTWIQAKLIQDPPIVSTVQIYDSLEVGSHYAQKWFAAHRYQVNITRWMQVGINDMVVYGGRGIDWDYMPPLAFLWSMEHYDRDRDNVLQSLDFRFLLGHRLSLYGQWLLDELRFSRLGSSWFGNKHGYMLGLRQIDPFGVANADAAVEYVYVRPYVYTHTEAINVAQQYGRNLGYFTPPNSDVIFATWRQTLKRGLDATLSFQRMRHGSNPPGKNVGGDVHTPHRWNESETAKFLAGDLETLNEVTLGMEWEVSYKVFVKGMVSLGRRKLQPETGTASTHTERRASLSLLWYPYRWR